MPCGCTDPCNCLITSTDSVQISGDGSAGNPYQAVVIPGATCCDIFVEDTDTIDFSTPAPQTVSGDVRLNPDGGLQSTASGVSILADPASPSAVSLSAAGLSVACCSSGAATGQQLVVFTVGANFDKSLYPGLSAVKVTTVGGGGGSAGVAATGAATGSASGGGGGGGTAVETILASALAALEAVVVGAGGTAGAVTPTNGGVGGTSSFGAFHTAAGGGGGLLSAATSLQANIAGGGGGVAAGGDLNVMGGDGGAGTILNPVATLSTATGGTSGLAMGTQANGPGINSAASAGHLYGGGAGGASASGGGGTAKTGAAGAAGIVIVELIF